MRETVQLVTLQFVMNEQEVDRVVQLRMLKYP